MTNQSIKVVNRKYNLKLQHIGKPGPSGPPGNINDITTFKDACLAATESNHTLSGLTIDTTSQTGDPNWPIPDQSRILVREQTNPAENGIYIASAGAWSRATDLNESSEVKDGTIVVVQLEQHLYYLSAGAVPFIIGTSSMWFNLVNEDVYQHMFDTNNPHNVTAQQVGADIAQWNADRLLDIPIDQDTTPSDGQGLIYDATDNEYKFEDIGASAADKHFEQSFTVASTITVNHNLNKYPSVTVISSAGDEVEGDVDYINNTSLTVSFTAPFSGKVLCN